MRVGSARRVVVAMTMALVGALASPGLLPASAQGGGSQPNIVLINVDDADIDLLGREAVDQYFPNIATLIQNQGTRFENFHSIAPLCGPSRGALFRGQYPHNTQIEINALGWKVFHDEGYTDSEIGMWMKDAGYATALVGKYCHEEYPAASRNNRYVPPGWEEFHASLGGRYFGTSRNVNGRRYRLDDTGYRTDAEAASMRQIIADHDTAAPLFLYLAPFAPHGATPGSPGMVAPRHADKYPNARVPRTPDFNEADVSDKTPQYASLPPVDGQIGYIDGHFRERLRALRSVDDMVGELFTALDARSMTSNTYIFLTSDNGFQLGHHRDFYKNDPFDRTTRVTMIARGPGIPSGASTNHLLGHIDLAPTFLDLAGGTAPHFLDGKSFAPLLNDLNAAPPSTWQRSILIENTEGKTINGVDLDVHYVALRRYSDVYVEWDNGDREYYDLATDPYQLENRWSSLSSLKKQNLANQLAAKRTCQGGACTGTGSIDPITTTTAVTNDSVITVSPPVLTGSATDNTGVADVGLVIRRVSDNRYWNGSGFGDPYAYHELTATLGNPGGRNTSWRFSSALPPGDYWHSARATDVVGNEDPKAATGFFSLGATAAAAPTATITSPQNGVTVSDQLNVTGTASDDLSVAQVLVTVRNTSTGQYWNGTSMQSAYTRVSASLTNPNNATTSWTLTATPPPGPYYISARPFDGSGLWQDPPPNIRLTVEMSIADTTDPTATIDSPADGSVIAPPLFLQGTAQDDQGVSRVLVTIRNLSTGRYWNGSGFQDSYVRSTANLSTPNAPTSGWDLTTSPPAGRYYISARVFDTSGNWQSPPPNVRVTLR